MSSNIIDNIRVRGNQSRNQINKILAELQDLQSIDAEDEAVAKRIAITNPTRKKSNSIGQEGAPNEVLTAGTKDRRSEEIQYKIPTSCQSFPHIITTNGMGNDVFPAGVELQGTKFGGKALFSNGNNLQVDYISGGDMDIGITDPFTIAFWLKYIDTGFQCICGTSNTVNAGQGISLFSVANIMRFDMRNVTPTQYRLDVSGLSANTWYSVVCTKSSVSNKTGMSTYIDKVKSSGGSEAMTGDFDNGNGWGIGDTPNESGTSNNSIAHWTFLKEEVNQAWVDNYHVGHIDLSGGNFVVGFPMVGDSQEMTEAFSNYCVSS